MMKSTRAPMWTFLILTFDLASTPRCTAQDHPVESQRTEVAQLPDGSTVTGRLVSDRALGAAFIPEGGTAPLAWEKIAQVAVTGTAPDATAGVAPYQVQLGSGFHISGRLVGLDASAARLDPGLGRPEWRIARSGISAVIQRPGEFQILREGFESLDPARWSQTGAPEIQGEKAFVGPKALSLPVAGASITARLSQPLASGRAELAFWDDATRVAGQRWYVDLSGRKASSELATLRVVPAWSEETMGVETPGGPALTVQHLARKAGWHRLTIRLDPEQTTVLVDGAVLAHGRGLGGPLVEIRIAAETTGAAQPPRGLAVIVDDLRIIRLVEPAGQFENDPAQDEVRLASGDQLFGTVEAADGDGVRLKMDGQLVRAAWSDVSGIYPRRFSGSSSRIDGLWAEVEWRTAPGDDPRDVDRVEAVIASLDDSTMTLEIPFVGKVTIPRKAILRVAPRGQGSRIVIDARSRHLGDRYTPDLDPPQAEATPLELNFTLADAPAEPAWFLIDAAKVIGEEGTRDYSDLVKNGELRTSLTLNGRRVDDLNKFVTSRGDDPQRLRIPIPAGTLKAGANTLRIDQAGTKAEPKVRDNLGLLRIAIEFAPARGAKAVAP